MYSRERKEESEDRPLQRHGETERQSERGVN